MKTEPEMKQYYEWEAPVAGERYGVKVGSQAEQFEMLTKLDIHPKGMDAGQGHGYSYTIESPCGEYGVTYTIFYKWNDPEKRIMGINHTTRYGSNEVRFGISGDYIRFAMNMLKDLITVENGFGPKEFKR